VRIPLLQNLREVLRGSPLFSLNIKKFPVILEVIKILLSVIVAWRQSDELFSLSKNNLQSSYD